MTKNPKIFGRRGGRHVIRTSGAVSALLESPVVPDEGIDPWHTSDSSRTVLAHTTTEWNALRHAV
jgi:hypothetical protein